MDTQEFRNYASRHNALQQIVQHIQDVVVQELKAEYPNIVKDDENDIPQALAEINSKTGEQFIVIIDEWDCLFCEKKKMKQSRKIMSISFVEYSRVARLMYSSNSPILQAFCLSRNTIHSPHLIISGNILW